MISAYLMVLKRPQKRMNAGNLIKLENNLALLYGKEVIRIIEKLKPEIEKWNEFDFFPITYVDLLKNNLEIKSPNILIPGSGIRWLKI